MRDGSMKWQTFSSQYCKDERERGQREKQQRWIHQAMLQEVRSIAIQEIPFGTVGDKYSCCVFKQMLAFRSGSIHSLYIRLTSGSHKPFPIHN